MGRTERIDLIRAIEKARRSRVLTYVTGDRLRLETRIAFDAIPFCLSQLSHMRRPKKVDLFLYSTGGMTMAGYALANLFREFSDSFSVIVPFKALSCATLICLGADEILMTKMGQLSPIDPSVDSPFGPRVEIPGQPGVTRTVPINVEDVITYLDLAKRELNISEPEDLVRVFDRLSQEVHPLALGGIYRAREQIAFLATNLLKYHMKAENQIKHVVETLIRGRFSHEYLFGRREAKEVLRLPIVDMPPNLEFDVAKLYEQYDQVIQLSVPYHPEVVLQDRETGVGEFNRAIIESTDATYVFRTTKEVRRLPPPEETRREGIVAAYAERVLNEAWIKDERI